MVEHVQNAACVLCYRYLLQCNSMVLIMNNSFFAKQLKYINSCCIGERQLVVVTSNGNCHGLTDLTCVHNCLLLLAGFGSCA